MSPSNELAAAPRRPRLSRFLIEIVFFFLFFSPPCELIEVMNCFFCPRFVYQRKVKGELMDSFCGNSCCARLLKHLCENTAANYSPPCRGERLLDKQEAEYKSKKKLFFSPFVNYSFFY